MPVKKSVRRVSISRLSAKPALRIADPKQIPAVRLPRFAVACQTSAIPA